MRVRAGGAWCARGVVRRGPLASALRAVVLAMLAGAGATPVVAASAAPACGTIVIPSGLGFAEADAVNTLHPLFGNGLELATGTLLYRPLVVVGADHRIDAGESLARAVTPDPSGTSFTIALKPALWSDGVPVTARDVLFTWHMIEALGPAYEEYGQGGIPTLVRDIVATDDHALRIRLTRPVNPSWFEDTGLPLLVPLPEHRWGGLSLARQQAEQTQAAFYDVVDGPFRLAGLALGRDAVFVPNPTTVGHRPDYRRLVVRFFPGADPLEALRTGEVDAANLPLLLGDASVAGLARFRRVTTAPSWLDDAILPNLGNPSLPFFRDPMVRLALARAIDQDRVIRLAFRGAGTVQHGFVPAAWTTFLPPDEQDGRSVAGYDPAAAASGLDRAGWRLGPDGVRRRGGRTFAFAVMADVDDQPSLLLLQVVQQAFAAIGVRMRIAPLAFNQLMARVVGPASGWDAVLFLQPSSPYPDATAALASGSADNYGRFSDVATDRLIARATASDAIGDLWALERRIEAEQPVIFLPAPRTTVLASPALAGVGSLVDAVGNWRPGLLRCR